MITVHHVIGELCKMGLSGIEVCYSHTAKGVYYNLNTRAKSHLYLFEDFSFEGRYGHSGKIDSDQSLEEILNDLFVEFKHCLCGRDYYNTEWMEIGVKLGRVKRIKKTTEEFLV